MRDNKTTTNASAATTAQNEYRFAHLNEGQRQQAVAMAIRDGRPNCIGLRFTLDGMGNVNGFRDEMPDRAHGTAVTEHITITLPARPVGKTKTRAEVFDTKAAGTAAQIDKAIKQTPNFHPKAASLVTVDNPWRMARDGTVMIPDPSGTFVDGEIALCNVAHAGATREEAMRNARLIKNAPALLALCKDLVEAIWDGRVEGCGAEYFSDPLRELFNEIDPQ